MHATASAYVVPIHAGKAVIFARLERDIPRRAMCLEMAGLLRRFCPAERALDRIPDHLGGALVEQTTHNQRSVVEYRRRYRLGIHLLRRNLGYTVFIREEIRNRCRPFLVGGFDGNAIEGLVTHL